MIAKLPPSWRSFDTTLRRKRTKISVESLIASLDVEEKARAKDTGKGTEGQSNANMVQKNYGRNKGKNKPNKKPTSRRRRTRPICPASLVVTSDTFPWTAQIVQTIGGKRPTTERRPRR
jgi:hypothetical protein